MLLATTLATTAMAQNRNPGFPQQVSTPDLPSAADLANVRVDDEVFALAGELSSDSFEQRELASMRLREGEYDRRQLYALLYTERLESEQRHRLLQVLRHRLVSTPRGALGISMRTRRAAVGEPYEIEVFDLIRGLPAERVLQIGDRIYRADGHLLLESDSLVTRIQSKRPGDVLKLSIRRVQRDEAGMIRRDQDDRPIHKEFDVELVLGSTQLLEDPDAPGRFSRSSVMVDRESEARHAAERFAPTPQRIQLAGGGDQSSFGVEGDQLMEFVDQDPAIQNLLAQIWSLQRGNVRDAQAVRNIWEANMQQLFRHAELSELSPNERERRLKVARRYKELVEGFR